MAINPRASSSTTSFRIFLVLGVVLGSVALGGERETIGRFFDFDVDVDAIDVADSVSLLAEPERSTKTGTSSSSFDEAGGTLAAAACVGIVSTGFAIDRRATTSSVHQRIMVGGWSLVAEPYNRFVSMSV